MPGKVSGRKRIIVGYVVGSRFLRMVTGRLWKRRNWRTGRTGGVLGIGCSAFAAGAAHKSTGRQRL